MEHQISESSALNAHPEDTPLAKFKKSVKLLLKSPRDLWIMYGVKFLGFSAFSILIISQSLFLTEVLGFSDIEFGIIISMQGVFGGLFTLFLGHFADRYGIRFSLLVGSSLKILCLLVLLFVGNRYVIILAILLLSIPGGIITIPTTKLAVKRYTFTDSRSMGYSVYFVILFAASAIAALAVDMLISFGGLEMSTFRYGFLLGVGAITVGLILIVFLRELDVPVSGETVVEIERRETSVIQDTRSVFILKKFWRFMLLTLVLVFVRTVYVHINITIPIYMTRELGEGAHFGYMIALHEICTLLFTPPLTVLIYYFSLYNLLIIGAVITAFSPLVFLVTGSYATVSIFVILTAIGEAIQAPRLLDYTIAIAPEQREGMFLAISAMPLIFSFVLAGIMAGVLLDSYCPDDGERECWKLWGIIALFSIAAVCIVILCKRWLEQPKFEANPYMSCSKESKSLILYSNDDIEDTVVNKID